MLIELSLLASTLSVDRKGEQFQKGHIEDLPTANLPTTAANLLKRHEITNSH
jgi:hypothetical protein